LPISNQLFFIMEKKVKVFRVRDKRAITIPIDLADNLAYMARMGLVHIEQPEPPKAAKAAKAEPKPQEPTAVEVPEEVPWDAPIEVTIEMARDLFKEAFGRAPHPSMKIEKILERIKNK
jgi:hypothetical protein